MSITVTNSRSNQKLIRVRQMLFKKKLLLGRQSTIHEIKISLSWGVYILHTEQKTNHY